MRCTLVLAACLVSGPVAAEPIEEAYRGARDEDHASLVLLNASAKLGDRGRIDRLRRVLDSRGLLAKLPEPLEATLEGRDVLITELEAIREAYGQLDFAAALALVEDNETRILQAAAGGDPIPALSQLAAWRGLIAAGMERPDEAVRWFRAAVRLNPAWTPDKKLAGPRVRPLIKQARKEVDATGRLAIDADPEDARVQIDGGKPQPVGERLVLPVGIHLVTITADGRETYAELVDIQDGTVERLEISLGKESKADRAAKLVDAAVAAPPGKTRLRRAKALSAVAGGATRFLVIEDGEDERVTLRVYDVETKKVSRPLELDGELSSAAIARKVMAALDPDAMIEPSTVRIVEQPRAQHWYERWYVWAGIAAVAGGGALGYHYLSREPTMVRF